MQKNTTITSNSELCVMTAAPNKILRNYHENKNNEEDGTNSKLFDRSLKPVNSTLQLINH